MTSSNCKVLLTSSKTTNLNIKTLLEKEKIENIIDRLNAAILDKISSYGEELSPLKKE